MGLIPRWLRLAVARGMNKGNCSFFARTARFSPGRIRVRQACGKAAAARWGNHDAQAVTPSGSPFKFKSAASSHGGTVG
jgi:hypothetical protein